VSSDGELRVALEAIIRPLLESGEDLPPRLTQTIKFDPGSTTPRTSEPWSRRHDPGGSRSRRVHYAVQRGCPRHTAIHPVDSNRR
jgi:hypothetical protein